MADFQNALERQISEVPRELLAALLVRKAFVQNVTIPAKAINQIVDQIMSGSDHQHFFAKGPVWKFWDRRKITLEITEQDLVGVIHGLDQWLGRMPELISVLTESGSHEFRKYLKRDWKAESRRFERARRGFRKRLFARWREPLENLEMLLALARHCGQMFVDRTAESETSKTPGLLDVSIRLHIRACQITEEIIVLLKAGFSDGAMARWRTLHEVVTVALFIIQNGEECAQKYTAHQVVENWKAMRDYLNTYSRLGFEPLEEGSFQQATNEKDEAERKFGKKFLEDYGWAADYLDLTRDQKTSIARIERATKLDHLRGFYRMASHSVHANPKGIFFKLTSPWGNTISAGPSNAGLADPGDSTALSLTLITTIFSSLRPDLDILVTLNVMADLQEKIGQDFLAASNQLLSDETHRLAEVD